MTGVVQGRRAGVVPLSDAQAALGMPTMTAGGRSTRPPRPATRADGGGQRVSPAMPARTPPPPTTTSQAPGTASLVSRSIVSARRHPLMNTWTFWFLQRPLLAQSRARMTMATRTTGEIDGSGAGAGGGGLSRLGDFEYEKEVQKLGTFGTLEDFWSLYSHLRRPEQLEAVSDLHLFRAGVRPIWEDEANARGGKWILRLKKGLAGRLWEALVLMAIADQADLPPDEVCGLVLSVRGNEDVISVWNKTCEKRPTRTAGPGTGAGDGGEMSLRVRDAIIRALDLPPSTVLSYKQHDDSIRDRRGV